MDLERCLGTQHPCGQPATHQWPTATGQDPDTSRTLWLPYCDAHWEEMTLDARPTDDRKP